MNDIYDHAPECDVAIWLERAIETDAPRWLGVPDDVACQCQKLRACERRVTEQWESLRGWGESYAYKTGSDNGFDIGYAAGLAAARDAVAALPKGGMGLKAHALWRDALAAIDALRGSGNPDTPPSAEKGEKP